MIEDSFGAFFLRRIITGNRTIVIQCKGKAGEGGWGGGWKGGGVNRGIPEFLLLYLS